MYRIIDNAGNVHEMPFTNDLHAQIYMNRHFSEFIASILTDDMIQVYRPDNTLLMYINTATGEQTVKHWNG